jgi:hypothetical protein
LLGLRLLFVVEGLKRVLRTLHAAVDALVHECETNEHQGSQQQWNVKENVKFGFDLLLDLIDHV